jgi:hypothetical protein
MLFNIALSVSLLLAPASTQIPKNFLLTEKEARTPPSGGEEGEVWWKISDSRTRGLELNPCGSEVNSKGRTAMRTITVLTSGPSTAAEQLVLHGSVASANAAFERLRADLKRCAVKNGERQYVVKKLTVGNEAVWVSGLGGWYTVARRGSALMLYTGDEGYYLPEIAKSRLVGQAKKMAAKVCTLPKVCARP